MKKKKDYLTQPLNYLILWRLMSFELFYNSDSSVKDMSIDMQILSSGKTIDLFSSKKVACHGHSRAQTVYLPLNLMTTSFKSENI